MADTSRQPNLYALLVGINNYQKVGNLTGMNDAKNMKSFLNDPMAQASFGKVDIKTIYDSEATKVNIVKGFTEHLAQAQEGDSVLFFFAGHGVREKTDVAPFRDAEADGNIAGIVCVESDPFNQDKPETNTLSDKEMRYLIRKLAANEDGTTKAHVVMIFDCCHSGGNTRSVLEPELPANARQVHRDPFDPRSWEGFVFHDDKEVKEKVQAGAELFDILPQGDHVMFAACREVELAWEIGGQGNFTTALVNVLKQNMGRVSYHELYTRVLNQMRFQYLDFDGDNDQRQTPQFYLNSPNKANRYNLFLTNEPNDMPTYGIVEFNSAEDEWRIDIGALQGVAVGEETEVDLYAGTSKEPLPSKAMIKTVFPSYSTLDMPWDFTKDPNVSYRGKVNGLGIPALKIFMSGQQDGIDLASKYFKQKLADARPKPFDIVEKEEEADYCVLVDQGLYQIVLPFDHQRPRVKTILYKENDVIDSTAPEWLYTYLVQISKWTFLKNVERTDVFEDPFGSTENFPIEVKVYKMDPSSRQEHPIQPKGNVFTIELTEKYPKLPIRLELINHSDKDLHVGYAYMSHVFGFDSQIDVKGGPALFKKMSSNPTLLAPSGDRSGSNVLRSSGKKIPGIQYAFANMLSGGYIKRDNWLGRSEFLKLVVSEVPFDIQSLHMDSLPGPGEKKITKRFSGVEDEEDPETPKWEIQTFELFITNPDFKPEKQPA